MKVHHSAGSIMPLEAINEPVKTPSSPWQYVVRAKQRWMYEELEGPTKWTELSRARNVGIGVSYFLVGFLPSFFSTPLQVYMVNELNAHPAVQNSIWIATTIPWSFKILYGFISDTCPVGGERRRPFIFLGYLICAMSYFCLAALYTPSAPSLALLVGLATFGMVMADTTCDSLVVERSRHEHDDDKGHLQSTCYALRNAGSVVAAICGACVYNRVNWGWGLTFQQVALSAGLLPVVLLFPCLPSLVESPREDEEPVSIRRQVANIWETVQLKAVWKPMAFVYTFNIFQVPNVAWGSYLQLSLHFSPWILGSMGVAGSIMTLVGILAYRHFFFRASWRAVYMWSVLLTAAFSCLQLLLIFQINTYWHISNYIFALGDDIITAYLTGIQFLPVCIMYLKLCPDGSEGATYALLTTMGNIGLICGNSIGSLLAKLWDVSNDAMRRQDYRGLWRLSLLTSCLSPLPLFLIKLLPPNHEKQRKLQESKQSSAVAGAIFLTVLFVSLLWGLSQAIAVVLSHH